MSRTAPKQGRSRYKPLIKVTQANKAHHQHILSLRLLVLRASQKREMLLGSTRWKQPRIYSMEAAQDAMHLAHQMQTY